MSYKSRNFFGASEIEDDYAFEEADDERTFFPDRGVKMDCEKYAFEATLEAIKRSEETLAAERKKIVNEQQ